MSIEQVAADHVRPILDLNVLGLLLTAQEAGGIGQPQDIAPAVVFLASPDASWITGETFYISGGNR